MPRYLLFVGQKTILAAEVTKSSRERERERVFSRRFHETPQAFIMPIYPDTLY
jgi:hypothetical protein